MGKTPGIETCTDLSSGGRKKKSLYGRMAIVSLNEILASLRGVAYGSFQA